MKKQKKGDLKNPNRVKAIIFDIGGVLAISNNKKELGKDHHSRGVHETVAKDLGVSIDQYMDSIDTAYANSVEGRITKKQVLKILSKNFNTSEKRIKDIFVRSYRKHFRENKRIYRFAFNLKKKGYKIAILSDQWSISKEAILIKRHIKRFNVVIISCDVGFRKPNPKIYKLVLKRLNLFPKEVIFIDNQKWNIKESRKLGIKSILFRNNRQLFRELKKFGVKE